MTWQKELILAHLCSTPDFSKKKQRLLLISTDEQRHVLPILEISTHTKFPKNYLSERS